jgi:hypothetical protein
MKKPIFIAVALVLLLVIVYFVYPLLFVEESSPTQADEVETHNTLSSREKEEGWQLLFDGKTTNNWHTYGGAPVGPAWRVEEGALRLYVPNRAGNNTPGGGNLVTDQEFSGDFELKADWKIEGYTNSGIFLFVQEDTTRYPQVYSSGLELQVTDNAIYEGADANNNKRAGDFFGIASATTEAVKPVGEWNQVHVIRKGNRLKVYMNDQLIHDRQLDSPEWKEAVAGSILKDTPVGQGRYEGRIGLQDWGSQVWYRNIKYRPL